MYLRFEAARDFYKNNKELTIALVGVLAGWLLTKVGPYFFSLITSFAKAIGRKLGGRLAYSGIQTAYLNWVVLQNQDLNLTGIVGSGEKPKLEQIFIPLRVVEQLEKPIGDATEGKLEDALPDTIWGRVGNILAGVIAETTLSKLLARQSESAKIRSAEFPGLELFHPSKFWRVRHAFQHGEIIATSLVIIVLALFVAFPAFMLFSDEPILIALGVVLALAPIVITGWFIADTWPADRADIVAALVVFTVFGALPGYAFVRNVLLHNQSPWPMAVGGVIVVALVVLIIRASRGPSQRKERTAQQVGKLLSAQNSLAILGKPGAGKSTYVQYLALTFAEAKAGERRLKKRGIAKTRFGTSAWFLPVLIPLRKVARFVNEESSKDIECLLIEAFRREVLPSNLGNTLSDSYIHYMLSKGKCLFLLDGLDEVADDDEFDAVTREIIGLYSSYPKNKFVVTSRFSGWRGGLGSSFRTYQLDDLNEGEIDEFIESWYQAIEENRLPPGRAKTSVQQQFRTFKATENARALKEGLRATERIRRLAENPLLLSIICFVHYHKVLPKERLSLYQDCSNLLLVQWDQEKGLPVDDTNLTLARKETIMQEVAFALHTGKIGGSLGRKEATESEIIPIVANTLKRFKMDPSQASLLFQKLINRSGIMVTIERFTGRYAFSHLTFQEFYAAKYIHESSLDVFQCIDPSGDELTTGLTGWWREVLLLLNAMQKDPSDIIEKLCEEDEADLLKRKLQIAAQSVSEAVELSKSTVEEKLMSKLLTIRANTSVEEVVRPEIRDYLLRFAMSYRFFPAVIATKVKSDTTNNLYPWLIRLLRSVDRNVQLAALEHLTDFARAKKLALEPSEDDVLYLLSSTHSDVRLATLGLVTLIQPASIVISKKAIDVFKAMLTNIRTQIFPARFHSNRPIFFEDIMLEVSQVDDQILCKILRAMPSWLSAAESRTFQALLAEFLRRGMSFGEAGNFYWQVQSDHKLTECISTVLTALDTPDERNVHMSQLVQASRKGSPSQQILARKLLAAAFSKEKEMLGLLVAGLRSEFSEVRSATLLLLPDLPFDAQTLASCRNILEDGLTDRSRTSRVKCKISEWIGIGSVGGSYGEQSEIAVALILLCKFDKKDGNYLSKLIDRLSPHVLETAIDALNRSEDGLLQITTEPQVVLQKLINKASLIALGPAVFEKLAMLAEPYRNSKERSLFRCWLRLWKP